jgi:transposase
MGTMTVRKPYPSDMSDEEWGLVAPYLCLLPESAEQRRHPLREVFNALRYLVRYGVTWRAMPNDLPPWHAVYEQAQRWLRAGCFEMLLQDLRAVLRLAVGRKEEPTAAVLDSRTLRGTPESGHRAAWNGHKRIRGSKVHMAVDTLGHLLALHVTPANLDDRAAVAVLAEAVQDVTGDSVDLAYVDQGYTGEAAAEAAGTHGIRLEVVGHNRSWSASVGGLVLQSPPDGDRAGSADPAHRWGRRSSAAGSPPRSYRRARRLSGRWTRHHTHRRPSSA